MNFKEDLKTLEHVIKEMKPRRGENNYFVKHPLQKNLEVPKWVVEERDVIFHKINTIRLNYKLPEFKPEEYQQIEQALTSYKKSKFYENLFTALLNQTFKDLSSKAETPQESPLV